MLGGGNPVGGANPAGIGTSLNYIGNHCYATSGEFECKTSDQTLLSFSTGNSYIIATLVMNAPIRFADITDGFVRGFKLNFNSETVLAVKADSSQEDMPAYIEVKVLIPPYTKVELICRDSTDNAAYLGTANLTGRVYG